MLVPGYGYGLRLLLLLLTLASAAPPPKMPKVSLMSGEVVAEENVANLWNGRGHETEAARAQKMQQPLVVANQTHNKLNKVYSSWVLRGVRRVTNISAVDEVCTQFFSIGASNQLKYPSMCLTAMPVTHRHHRDQLAKSPNNYDRNRPEYSISLQTCFANVHLALHQLFYMSDGNQVIRPMLHTEWRVVRNEKSGFYELKRDMFQDAPKLDAPPVKPDPKGVSYVGPCKQVLPSKKTVHEVPHAEKMKLTERRNLTLPTDKRQSSVAATRTTGKPLTSEATTSSKPAAGGNDEEDEEQEVEGTAAASPSPTSPRPKATKGPDKELKADRVSEGNGKKKTQEKLASQGNERETEDNDVARRTASKKVKKKKPKKEGGKHSDDDDDDEKVSERNGDDESSESDADSRAVSRKVKRKRRKRLKDQDDD